MINPTKKYSVDVNFLTFVPNYYRATLQEKVDLLGKEGWAFELMDKKAE
jgi:hypothetical protein